MQPAVRHSPDAETPQSDKALAIRDLRKTPVEDPSVLRDAADSRTRPEAYRMSSDFRARFNGWPIHEPSAGQGT